jgi:hypothetical protein
MKACFTKLGRTRSQTYNRVGAAGPGLLELAPGAARRALEPQAYRLRLEGLSLRATFGGTPGRVTVSSLIRAK